MLAWPIQGLFNTLDLKLKKNSRKKQKGSLVPKITIDNKEYEFENGMTVMQACEQAGTEIPILLS